MWQVRRGAKSSTGGRHKRGGEQTAKMDGRPGRRRATTVSDCKAANFWECVPSIQENVAAGPGRQERMRGLGPSPHIPFSRETRDASLGPATPKNQSRSERQNYTTLREPSEIRRLRFTQGDKYQVHLTCDSHRESVFRSLSSTSTTFGTELRGKVQAVSGRRVRKRTIWRAETNAHPYALRPQRAGAPHKHMHASIRLHDILLAWTWTVPSTIRKMNDQAREMEGYPNDPRYWGQIEELASNNPARWHKPAVSRAQDSIEGVGYSAGCFRREDTLPGQQSRGKRRRGTPYTNGRTRRADRYAPVLELEKSIATNSVSLSQEADDGRRRALDERANLSTRHAAGGYVARSIAAEEFRTKYDEALPGGTGPRRGGVGYGIEADGHHSWRESLVPFWLDEAIT
ncbi:hypothetical protein DENSPDRAFT_848339 [Dentipellis sp. KUC8613]|nr:hypothetical protein DENSPDRAFT_848339 [Dentipellis sp. KUC8613]